MGCDVTCIDIDPVAQQDIARAASCIQKSSGAVDFRLRTELALPFENMEVDVVYCISVLEHIANPEMTIKEVARILKPGGLFLLTIDLDLRGDSEIGPIVYTNLRRELMLHFKYRYADSTVHPAVLHDSTTGPFAYRSPKGLRRKWFLFKQFIKPLLGKSPRPLIPYLLAVQGFVLERKATIAEP